jgi:hypothetical protein
MVNHFQVKKLHSCYFIYPYSELTFSFVVLLDLSRVFLYKVLLSFHGNYKNVWNSSCNITTA